MSDFDGVVDNSSETSGISGVVHDESVVVAGTILSTIVVNDYIITLSTLENGHRMTVTRGGVTQTADWYGLSLSEVTSILQAEAARVLAESGRVMAETARVSAESSRSNSENSRVSAENGRVSAESARVSSESSRVNAESGRVSAENARVSAESVRSDNEDLRDDAETARSTAETSRASAETARVSAESQRVQSEFSRVAQEQTRAASESSRVSAESSRSSAENARNSSENSRVSAENGRVSAESVRVSSENARVQAEAARQSVINAKADKVQSVSYAGKVWTVGENGSLTFTDPSGDVTSVNGQTGDVVLDYEDVGAAQSTHTHDDRYYTETEADTLLAGKAASSHSHAQSDVTGLASALSGKISEPADEGTNGQVLTTDGNGGRSWTTVQGGVTSVNGETGAVVLDADDVGAAAAVHTHDDRYYTETETDTLLAGKAASSHAHAQADVTGLADALAGKASSVHSHAQTDVTGLVDALSGKASSVHTHAHGDITGLTDDVWTFVLSDGTTVTKTVKVVS